MTEPSPCALLSVTGPDALKFLDDLVTQDLAPLATGACAYAGLLTAQGKLIADFFVWRLEAGFLLDVAAARAADLEKRLKLYKLRAAVAIGPAGAPEGLTALDPRLPTLGARRPGDPGPALSARLALGVPDLAVDAAPEEVFALEALFEELNGVSFSKGCFVGQENVSRMKRRATTRKKFCPVNFEGDPPPFGAVVTAGAAELGAVRSAIPGRALALLRLDRALEALEKGQTLMVDGRAVRLDPPAWLLLPTEKDAA